MAAPVYPTILTKADWDKNKGTIGKHPTEFGLRDPLAAAWHEWAQIDWSVLQQCTVRTLRTLPHPLIQHQIARLQQAIPRIAATRTSLHKLGDEARNVVARYERSVTLPKPLLEHLRRMQQAAVDFAAELEQNNLQRELLWARKAKGYARVRDLDIQKFLDQPELSKLFLPTARKGFCEEGWQFLMETRCTTKGVLPAPERVSQIYRDFVENNDANIGVEKQKVLIGLHKDGKLVRPPAGSEEPVRKAWEDAHKECMKMYFSRYAEWIDRLPIDGSDNLLLDRALQA